MCDGKYQVPLLEIRAYGHKNKAFFMGIDIGEVATALTLKFDGVGQEDTLDLTLDLKALGKEVYKDEANSEPTQED